MSRGGWQSVYLIKGPGRNLPLDALKSWAVPGAAPLSPKAPTPLVGAVVGDIVGPFFLSGLT